MMDSLPTEVGAVAGPIALVTFLPDARADTFDLLQSNEPGAPTIAKEPQRGIVEFYQRAADVPLQLPPRTASAVQSLADKPDTFIVDVSGGGFARLAKPATSTTTSPTTTTSSDATPDIQVSSGAFVQQFVAGQPFRGAADGDASQPLGTNGNGGNNNNNKKVGGWPWWATALLISLALLAIIASIVAIVLAVIATNKERAEAERLAKDEERLARAEASLFPSR